MKKKISKQEALKKIDDFFYRDYFRPKEVKKIKRLAMKFNIKLGDYRKKFCKKCLAKLKGKTRVDRIHKTVICSSCGFKNRLSIAKET